MSKNTLFVFSFHVRQSVPQHVQIGFRYILMLEELFQFAILEGKDQVWVLIIIDAIADVLNDVFA